jgi:hypothetical protein
MAISHERPEVLFIDGTWDGIRRKSVRRIKTKVSQLLTPGNKGAWPELD